MNSSLEFKIPILISIYSVIEVQQKLQTMLQNQPSANDVQPSPVEPSTEPPPPLTRRFSVTENFQEGHNLWQGGYDGYLAAEAGVLIEEVPNGNSTDSYIDARIGERRGYIPKDILIDN